MKLPRSARHNRVDLHVVNHPAGAVMLLSVDDAGITLTPEQARAMAMALTLAAEDLEQRARARAGGTG